MPDLAGVIAAGGGGNANMRIGTVKAFNAAAGTLTVTVAGTDMPGAFYNPAYLPLVGDVVAVMNAGPTWYVMGSTSNALARTTPVTANVGAAEFTTSGTYGDLSTVGPSVTAIIGSSGRATLTLGAIFAGATNSAYMSFAASGANTISPSDTQCVEAASLGHQNSFSRELLLTNLASGSTTFTAKYRSGDGASAFFSIRTIDITPN